jgi:uncharacterized protein YkwD
LGRGLSPHRPVPKRNVSGSTRSSMTSKGATTFAAGPREYRRSRDMIRLRGGALLMVGVVLLFVALSFTGAVAANALRHDGQTIRLHAPPVGVRLAAPIEDLKREPPDAAPQKEPVAKPLSTTYSPSVQTPTPHATKPPPQSSESWIHGDKPAADTSTLVNVRTCDGGTFALNVAEKEMFDLHNETRTAHGLGPLCLSSVLTTAARARSQDMLNRDYFSHYTPGGVTVIGQLQRKGYYSSEPGDYQMLGENIAMGGDGSDEDTPEHLFTGLMQSEGHRENILRGEFEEVGVGARSGTYQQYDDISTIYTTVFGGH